jgi:hypothetical protein
MIRQTMPVGISRRSDDWPQCYRNRTCESLGTVGEQELPDARQTVSVQSSRNRTEPIHPHATGHLEQLSAGESTDTQGFR